MTKLASLVGDLYDHLPFKQPVLTALRPYGLPEPVYRHLHFRGQFDVAVEGVGRFRMNHCGEQIENETFWEGLPGKRERLSMALWMQLCKSANVILDIGANVGVFALAAATVNPRARIMAFEPLPDVYPRMVRNFELNGFKIDAHQVALSDRDGTARMNGWRINDDGVVEVPVRRLEDVLDAAGIEQVDLLKVDVELHEPEVMRGFARRLYEQRPTLLIEVLTVKAAEKLAPLLEPCGYNFYDLDEVSQPRRIPGVQKSSHWNLLACRPDVAATIGLS